MFKDNDSNDLNPEKEPKRSHFSLLPNIARRLMKYGLSRDAFAIYCLILEFPDKCYLSQEQIGIEVGISCRKVVRKIINELTKPRTELNGKSLIKCTKRSIPNRHNHLTNFLEIVDIWTENEECLKKLLPWGCRPQGVGALDPTINTKEEILIDKDLEKEKGGGFFSPPPNPSVSNAKVVESSLATKKVMNNSKNLPSGFESSDDGLEKKAAQKKITNGDKSIFKAYVSSRLNTIDDTAFELAFTELTNSQAEYENPYEIFVRLYKQHTEHDDEIIPTC